MRDRWHKCQSHKLPGIPRLELLGYLRTAAEVVDYVYRQHSIHHLRLNPRLLLSGGGRPASRRIRAGGTSCGCRPASRWPSYNARYAAPELFQGQAHRSSDQYSLAIIYQELLTGVHPLGDKLGKVVRRRLRRGQAEPRASSGKRTCGDCQGPRSRSPDAWQKCGDLIRALEGQRDETLTATSSRQDDAMHEIIISPSQPPHPRGYELPRPRSAAIFSATSSPMWAARCRRRMLSVCRCCRKGATSWSTSFASACRSGPPDISVDAFRLQCSAEVLGEDRTQLRLSRPSAG